MRTVQNSSKILINKGSIAKFKKGSFSKFNELKGSRENNRKTLRTADYLNTGALPGSTIHAWVRLNYAPQNTTRVRRKRFLCLGFEDALYPARQFRSNIQKCAIITEKVLDHQEKSKTGLVPAPSHLPHGTSENLHRT